ncbi:MAG TPA: hypothetical protein VK886_18140 [Vicinamibacterales bacterium]|nr:hypothetical protein [Vicinamibacterales bacterium]
MGDSQQDLAREEYRELRATIRQRGSLRPVLFVATLGAWGALVVATNAAFPLPIATLVPLLVLAAGFETVAALHIGVERVGRYVQVRFEGDVSDSAALPAAGPAWERTAMAWGARFPGTGTDPLFSVIFLIATAINAVPLALTAALVELTVLGMAHLAFAWRVWRVRVWATRQRKEDLATFRELASVTRDRESEQQRAGGPLPRVG